MTTEQTWDKAILDIAQEKQHTLLGAQQLIFAPSPLAG